MATIVKNTIFTNVAETSDGEIYWEGIDQELPEGVTLTSWKNKSWSPEDGKNIEYFYITALKAVKFRKWFFLMQMQQ